MPDTEPTIDQYFRARILQAARLCFVESPDSDRIHSAIARSSGLSRQTVYKYVGDQKAIEQALIGQEMLSYLTALESVSARSGSARALFPEQVVFTVEYIRDHELSGLLLTNCEEVIRATVHAVAVPCPVDVILEWVLRVSFSLITTASPYWTFDSRASIRASVDELLDVLDATSFIDSSHR